MGNGMRWLIAAVLALGCLLGSAPQGEAFSLSRVDTSAWLLVTPMQNKTQFPAVEDCLGAADATFTTELDMADVFQHIRYAGDEKQQLDEQAFQHTGLTETAANALAQKVQARYVLYSTLMSLSLKSGGGRIDIGNTGGFSDVGRVKAEKVTARVMIRVIDRTTGDVVFYGSGTGTSGSADIQSDAIPLHIGAYDVTPEECNNAIQKAIDDVLYGKEGLKETIKG